MKRSTIPSKKYMAETAAKHGSAGFVFIGTYNKDGSEAFTMHGPIDRPYANRVLKLALSKKK